jgi:hypothetical protein
MKSYKVYYTYKDPVDDFWKDGEETFLTNGKGKHKQVEQAFFKKHKGTEFIIKKVIYE